VGFAWSFGPSYDLTVDPPDAPPLRRYGSCFQL